MLNKAIDTPEPEPPKQNGGRIVPKQHDQTEASIMRVSKPENFYSCI
jgi:hypothetical protein